jgi:WD40 repeat protein
VSITSLQFLKHSCLLASASDTSSTVKLWDVRMMEDPVAFLPAELPPDTALPPHLNMVPLSNHVDFQASSGLCHLSTDPDGACSLHELTFSSIF